MKIRYLLSVILAGFLFSCGAPQDQEARASFGRSPADPNPAAPGFDRAGSDPEAIALADSVMAALGGRAAWDATRYLEWTFFGRRTLLWDKGEGRVRIDIPEDSILLLLDYRRDTGKAATRGRLQTEPDSIAYYLNLARRIWINDSYWLVMPFKLKDDGVTLTYLGRDTTESGQEAEAVRLTFENVGVTPQNKYHVLIDPATFRVVEWRYFADAGDETPALTTPWQDYRSYGNLLLAGDRGKQQLSDIAVYDTLPDSVFTIVDIVKTVETRPAN